MKGEKEINSIEKIARSRYGLGIDGVNKIFNTSMDIAENRAIDTQSLAAFPQILTYITFPHSRPMDRADNSKECMIWEKTSGPHTLMIKSGVSKNKDGNHYLVGVPYGSIPRLIMAYISREVIRHKRRQVFLGTSFKDFMSEFNFDSCGRRNRSVRDQLLRIVYSTITYEYRSKHNSGRIVSEIDSHVTDERMFWWSMSSDKECNDAVIVLNSEFYKSILNHSFPIDLRGLLKLKQSPLAMDYYLFLSYKLPRLKKDLVLSWDNIKNQFGTEISDTKNFKRKSKVAIRKVMAIYRDANVDIEKSGRIILRPSNPILPRN